MTPPRILVVDDSKITRRVVSAIVNSRWTVCGEAQDSKSALKQFRELKPDLVLLDLAMPDIDGLEVGRKMHAINPLVPLILFTLLDPWGLEAPARQAGISRVISKAQSWELLKGIEEVVASLETSRQQAKSSRAAAK